MKKICAFLGSLMAGSALFADGATFIPADVVTAVGTSLSSAQTQVTGFITSNFTTIVTLVGGFLAIPLIWFVYRIVRRALGKA